MQISHLIETRLGKDLDLRISQVIETRLGKDYKVGISDLVEVRHGKVHETWASPEIAIDFAGWLSLKFSAFVRPIFIQYLKRN